MRLRLVKLVHSHGVTLLCYDILNRRRDVLWFPQPSRAAMPCPTLAARPIQLHFIEVAAAVNFEVAHDPLWQSFGINHYVNVIAANVGRQQTPAAMRTHFLNRLQDGVTAGLIKVVRSLIHTLRRGCDPYRIQF